jgi:hypothetical protein
MEEFINKWQTLIGSALGPFLAVIFSALGFWLKSKIEEGKERKEHLRRVEISVTRTLDDTYKTRLKLQNFVSRLKTLVKDIKAINNPRHFSLESINFPTIRESYRDIESPTFKVKSYYLHNMLLWIDAGTKETNETVVNLKSDFAELQRKNELHIILMRQNQNPDAALQRKEYAENLETFAVAIEEFINRFIKQGIKIMTQAKIYNDHLRKKHHGRWFLWRNEGTRFKYFKDKKSQKAFARNLDSMERIDKVIEKEVESSIKEAEERGAKLNPKE